MTTPLQFIIIIIIIIIIITRILHAGFILCSVFCVFLGKSKFHLHVYVLEWIYFSDADATCLLM